MDKINHRVNRKVRDAWRGWSKSLNQRFCHDMCLNPSQAQFIQLLNACWNLSKKKI